MGMLLFDLHRELRPTPAHRSMVMPLVSAVFLVCLLGLAFLRSAIPYYPAEAYLVKKGISYAVIWYDPLTGVSMKGHESLKGALELAKKDLHVVPRQTLKEELQLEWIDLQHRSGKYILLWKVAGIEFLNQISFSSSLEAEIFKTAFEEGAYAPSPLGHAIFLGRLK